MIWFDFKFMELAASLSLVILIFSRYVDDIDCVVRKVKHSLRFDEQRLMMIDDYPVSDDNTLKTDEGMMQLLRQVADIITSMITWEADWPVWYPDNQLPVLDLKLSLDCEDKYSVIKYRFFQKAVANQGVVSASSGMPKNMMYSTFVEEGCRRLRNTSPSILQEEKTELLREFNGWLMKAGHDEKFRLKVTEGTLS